MDHVLFLSHSGIDTPAALQLKQRLVQAAVAKGHGLEVWFDKESLVPGRDWQAQIEDAIERSTAFAVLVGSSGVINWVEAEVRLAVRRASTDRQYPFVPVFGNPSIKEEALPAFARRYQGVRDVDRDQGQFSALLGAILRLERASQPEREKHPFFGLRAIDETRNHLFFGREKETDTLERLVRAVPLVLVHGDSGAGKSSLVHAGLVPRFRGAAFAESNGGSPGSWIWHVVTMRPKKEPWRSLGEAVERAASRLGRSAADIHEYAQQASSRDGSAVRRGLRCGLDSQLTRILLVVDQFEELVTLTSERDRAPFIDLLLDLADPQDPEFRVVLTMRQDYVNLCTQLPALMTRLDADDRRARFYLGPMTPDGVQSIVTKPLDLAGVAPKESAALAKAVGRDVSGRPGDLALVQMALTEAWEQRAGYDDDLVNAYIAAGRVEGALAKAADQVRVGLTNVERQLLDSILVRLVQLGDTGGATRRIAAREEFSDEGWKLVERLASEEGKRLVLLGGSDERPTVEIAHEALVTAWPHFQAYLQVAASEKRILDQLIPRARAWAASPGTAVDRFAPVAAGSDLVMFQGLYEARRSWLSREEVRFIEASARRQRRQRRRKILQIWSLVVFGALMAFTATLALWFYWDAIRSTKKAQSHESRMLAAISLELLADGDREGAARMALRALPSDPAESEPERPIVPEAVAALQSSSARPELLSGVATHTGSVLAIALLPDGRLVTGGDDRRILVWSLDRPGAPVELGTHDGSVRAIVVVPDGRVVTGGDDKRVRVWRVDQPGVPIELGTHDGPVQAVAVLPGGRVVTGGDDKRVRVWRVDQPGLQMDLGAHDGSVQAVAVLRDGRVVTGGDDKRVRVWRADRPGVPVEVGAHDGAVQVVAVLPDGRVVTAGDDRTVLVWAVDHPGLPVELGTHDDWVQAVAVLPDNRVVTGGHDKRVRLWRMDRSGVPVEVGAHDGSVQAVVALAGGRVVTGGSDRRIRVWRLDQGEAPAEVGAHDGSVHAVAVLRDGRVVTGGDDKRARVWPLEERGLPIELSSHNGSVQAVAVLTDGRVVTGGADSRVLLWRVDDPEAPIELGSHRGAVHALAVLPDGRVVTGGADRRVLVWGVDQPGPPIELGVHDDWVRAVAALPDGRVVTAGDDQRVRLWRVEQPGVPVELGTHDDWVQAVAVFPDGRVVTGGDDQRVRLWQVEQPGVPVELGTHDGSVRAVAVLSDGRVVTGGDDKRVRVWRVDQPGVPGELGAHDGIVQAIAVSPDGRVVTGGDDKRIRQHDVRTRTDLGMLVDSVRARLVSTELTPIERRRAGLD